MANINDFNILNKKCMNYFSALKSEINSINKNVNLDSITDIDKMRLGFYILTLEMLCNIQNLSDIIELITDTDFNRTIGNEISNDFGIDAIYINSENNTINIFNFKYRDNFKPNSTQSLNDAIISSKFFHAIESENLDGMKGKIQILSQKIIKKLNGNEPWKFKFFMVTNDLNPLSIESSEIENFRRCYDLEIFSITLSSITEMFSLRPLAINAKLVVDNNSLLSFSRDNKESAKSYIIKISGDELIRITCNNKNLRKTSTPLSSEEENSLLNSKMEFDLLFDNVRGLIVKSRFNKNIFKTLKNDPYNFFMFNNGLTLVAEEIEVEAINLGKKYQITLSNFQVVNGGQTLRTLHMFNNLDKQNLKNSLTRTELLVRIFKPNLTDKDIIRNKIAEYTNSQNSISLMDLKSLASEQIQIEQFLAEHKILYIRKIGDIGKNDNGFNTVISMEKLGQIIFAIKGFPEKVSNQKKQIFDKYYNDIFVTHSDVIPDLDFFPTYIHTYYRLRNIYQGYKQYKYMEQKIFFILYMKKYFNKFGDNNYDKNLIDHFEQILSSYIKNIPPARKLIQANFKNHLDEQMRKINLDIYSSAKP